MTMPADRERDRRSLQDLAKMAQMTPPPPSTKSAPSGVQRAAEAKKDDSGIVDLAAAAASDPAAPARAQSTPLASQGLFDDEPASVRPPPPSAQQPLPSVPPMSAAPASVSSQPIAPVAQAAAAPQVATPAKKKSGSGAVIALVMGGLVAVSAAAAGGFFFLKHRAAEQLAALSTTTTTPVTPATTPATPAPDSTGTAAATPTDPTPGSDDPKLASAAKGATVKGAPKGVAFAAPPPPVANAPKAEEPPKLTQKDLPKTDNGPPGDLGKAMEGAVGPKSNDPTPAANTTGPQFAAGSVPTKPSQGAVTGALGAVLPAARACLGPDDPISRAVVVFGSNGSVQSVSVSGGAAGKPAEACIKGALMKAKVTPFAEATYSAPVTIRH
jgi:hypothetical protein